MLICVQTGHSAVSIICFVSLTISPPFSCLLSCIQYGGRITDDFDELLMDTFAEKYFHQGVLTLGYELYKDDRSSFSYRCGRRGGGLLSALCQAF